MLRSFLKFCTCSKYGHVRSEPLFNMQCRHFTFACHHVEQCSPGQQLMLISYIAFHFNIYVYTYGVNFDQHNRFGYFDQPQANINHSWTLLYYPKTTYFKNNFNFLPSYKVYYSDLYSRSVGSSPLLIVVIFQLLVFWFSFTFLLLFKTVLD